MSECVVRIEMPEDCQYCPMANWDIRNRLMGCDAAHGKRYLQGKDDEFWKDGRPSWCPIICQLPEGHGRLVDGDKLMGEMKNRKWMIGRASDPDCLVFDAPTIVPAEAERSET